MELIRLGVVYLHLVACCIAIGLILTSDLKMIKQLAARESAEHHDPAHLDSLQSTISSALIALWITGAAIIWLDASTKGLSYFYNPKLQAKIGMVILVTLNGYLLHSAVMPAIKKAGSLLDLKFNQRMLAIFCGVVSGVSWLYAAMLGVGRPLAWKYSLVQLLAAYPFLIASGVTSMLAFTIWANNRDRAGAGDVAKI